MAALTEDGTQGELPQRGRDLTLVTSGVFALHAPDAEPDSPIRLRWARSGVELATSPQPDHGSLINRGLPTIMETSPDGPLPDEQLAMAHSRRYLTALREYAAGGGGPLSLDTDVTTRSYEAAAVGSAAAWLGVAEATASGVPSLVLVRPPGHHATTTAGKGFCLINHAGVVAKSLAADGRRVAVFDWDVHHGDGTAEILAADPDCLYVSVHEYPLYPFSGWLTEAGKGRGEGKTVNLPLPGNLTDDQLLSAVRRIVVPCLLQHKPDVLVVSAGVDGHWTDSMSTWRLSARCYHELAATARTVASAGGAALVVLLEGGYTEVGLRLGLAGITTGLLNRPLAPAVAADAAPGRASSPRQEDAFAARLDEIARFQSRYWQLA